MGSLYFLVATLPTNLYHYIQHLNHYINTTPLSGGYVYFLVATLPTNLYHYIQHFYHYIKHLYQWGLYIFLWPHCPQTYITTYNTPIRGLCIFSGGHTAHKLISLHTTTPSGGYVYFLVATLPTNLYYYIKHLYQ